MQGRIPCWCDPMIALRKGALGEGIRRPDRVFMGLTLYPDQMSLGRKGR